MNIFVKHLHRVLLSSCLIMQLARPSYSQVGIPDYLPMPVPGTRVSVSDHQQPAFLKGIALDPRQPLALSFVIDHDAYQQPADVERLVSYFLAGLTLPDNTLWVNLSPNADEDMITPVLGDTVMGRDLLAQDYLLKQVTASLTYPEEQLGQQFWNMVYAQAYERYGDVNIPVDMFHKVWVVPEQVSIFESIREDQWQAYITEASLDVMLAEDYHARRGLDHASSASSSPVVTEVLKEVVMPVLKKEINEGRQFQALRQIYYSLILAKWMKMKNKEFSSMMHSFIDQNKIKGVDHQQPNINDNVYAQYVDSLDKGVFNYIREDVVDFGADQQKRPRQYFSGGLTIMPKAPLLHRDFSQVTTKAGRESQAVQIMLDPVMSNNHMMTIQHNPFLNRLKQSDPDLAFRIERFFNSNDKGLEKAMAQWGEATDEDILAELDRRLALPESDPQSLMMLGQSPTFRELVLSPTVGVVDIHQALVYLDIRREDLVAKKYLIFRGLLAVNRLMAKGTLFLKEDLDADNWLAGYLLGLKVSNQNPTLVNHQHAYHLMQLARVILESVIERPIVDSRRESIDALAKILLEKPYHAQSLNQFLRFYTAFRWSSYNALGIHYQSSLYKEGLLPWAQLLMNNKRWDRKYLSYASMQEERGIDPVDEIFVLVEMAYDVRERYEDLGGTYPTADQNMSVRETNVDVAMPTSTTDAASVLAQETKYGGVDLQDIDHAMQVDNVDTNDIPTRHSTRGLPHEFLGFVPHVVDSKPISHLMQYFRVQ